MKRISWHELSRQLLYPSLLLRKVLRRRFLSSISSGASRTILASSLAERKISWNVCTFSSCENWTNYLAIYWWDTKSRYALFCNTGVGSVNVVLGRDFSVCGFWVSRGLGWLKSESRQGNSGEGEQLLSCSFVFLIPGRERKGRVWSFMVQTILWLRVSQRCDLPTQLQSE